MENKNKSDGNENNYALSKLIVDNCSTRGSMEEEDPDFCEFTLYDRSSGTRSKIEKIYTDIKIGNITNSNHIMVSFTDHYNAISLHRIGKE